MRLKFQIMPAVSIPVTGKVCQLAVYYGTDLIVPTQTGDYREHLVCYINDLLVACTDDSVAHKITLNINSNNKITALSLAATNKFFVSITSINPNSFESDGLFVASTATSLQQLHLELTSDTTVYNYLTDYFPVFSLLPSGITARPFLGIVSATFSVTIRRINSLNVLTFDLVLDRSDISGFIFEFLTKEDDLSTFNNIRYNMFGLRSGDAYPCSFTDLAAGYTRSINAAGVAFPV